MIASHTLRKNCRKQKTKPTDPLGLPGDFVVQTTAAVADLVVDVFDRAAVLEDGVRLRQGEDA